MFSQPRGGSDAPNRLRPTGPAEACPAHPGLSPEGPTENRSPIAFPRTGFHLRRGDERPRTRGGGTDSKSWGGRGTRSLGGLPGGGGSQQALGCRRGARGGLGGGCPAGAGWRLGQAGSWQGRPGWGGGGAGEAGLGDHQPGSQPQPRWRITCCASRVGSTPFAGSLSPSAPPAPTSPPGSSPKPHLLIMGFLEQRPGLQGPAETRPQALRREGSAGSAGGPGSQAGGLPCPPPPQPGTAGRWAPEGQGGAAGPTAPGSGRQQVWAAAEGVGGSQRVGWGVALRARV